MHRIPLAGPLAPIQHWNTTARCDLPPPRQATLGHDSLTLMPTSCRTGSPVPNHFRMQGWNDRPQVAGHLADNLKQSMATAKLGLWAAQHALHPDKSASLKKLKGMLKAMAPNPPLAGNKPTFHEYRSHIPHAKAQDVFNYFCEHPAAAFGAAGLRLHPAPQRLEHGTRFAIEYASFPGLLSPVAVQLDPDTRTVRLQTLDGHFFRGANQFQFQDDGQDGVLIKQTMLFQGNSVVTDIGMIGDLETKVQQLNWTRVHAHLFEAFQP